MEYSEDRIILQRTGAIVTLVGIAQFIVGMASAPKGVYNFQILGIVIGCAIAFGNMRLVSAVRWLACLGLLAGALIMLGEILMMPAGLHLAQLRFMPGQVALHYGGELMGIAMTFYVFRQLGRPPLLQARAAAGRKQRDMRIPLILGGLLGLAAAWFQARMVTGDDAMKARGQVMSRVGPGFEYFTTAGNVQHRATKRRVFAMVEAWNDRELWEFPVQWEE